MAFDSREPNDVPRRAVAVLGVGAADRRRADTEKRAKNQARIVPVRRPPFNAARRRHRRVEIGAQRCVVVRDRRLLRAISRMSRTGSSERAATEAFARDALDAVAAHGVGRDAARDRKPKPSTRRLAGASLHVEVRRARRAGRSCAGGRKSAGFTMRAACGKRAPLIAGDSVLDRSRDATERA